VHTKWMALCYAGVRAHSVEACKAVRVKARRLLVAGREHAQLDILRDLYDATIDSHDDEEKGHEFAVKEREEFFAAVPGFSITWEAKNLDGSMFRLADQRGKVLVLYFWTTGCEYNVLAAPQICQLAADYQGKKDVAIVGMFIRSKIADQETKARYLIGKCLQGFPHLEAKEIAALYRFQRYGLGCPTTMVLDQGGRVHEVQDGYSDDLAQYIRKIVDDLRSKPPAKSE
jgi:thiol-disulfide isomerase/thioredoxin